MTAEFGPRLSKREVREAEKSGSTDTEDYSKEKGSHYSDKTGHRLRGEANKENPKRA